jgi:hypothetical protein
MTRRNILLSLVLPGILLLLSTVQLRGQAVANAQISGAVTDASGAGVSSAKVAATQTDTGQVRRC